MIGISVGSIVSDKKIQELIAVPASVMVSEAVSKMQREAQRQQGVELARTAH